MIMHREAFIEKLTEIQQNVEQLLAQLQASEHDKFAAHLYRSRDKLTQKDIFQLNAIFLLLLNIASPKHV